MMAAVHLSSPSSFLSSHHTPSPPYVRKLSRCASPDSISLAIIRLTASLLSTTRSSCLGGDSAYRVSTEPDSIPLPWSPSLVCLTRDTLTFSLSPARWSVAMRHLSVGQHLFVGKHSLFALYLLLLLLQVSLSHSQDVRWSYMNETLPSHSQGPACYRSNTPTNGMPSYFGAVGGEFSELRVTSAVLDEGGVAVMQWNSSVTPLPPLIFSKGTAQSNGILAVMGGRLTSDSGAVWTNTVWWSADKFSSVHAYSAPWSNRSSHVLFTVPGTNLTVLAAGLPPTTGNTPFTYTGGVWLASSLENGPSSWTLQTDVAPWGSFLSQAAGVALTDRTLILAGGALPSQMFVNSVYSSSDLGVSWQFVSNASFSPRASHSMTADSSGAIFVYGGYTRVNEGADVSVNSEMWMSSDRGVSWIMLSGRGDSAIPTPFLVGQCMVLTSPQGSTSSFLLYGGTAFSSSGLDSFLAGNTGVYIAQLVASAAFQSQTVLTMLQLGGLLMFTSVSLFTV
jgi:hypothetical protein